MYLLYGLINLPVSTGLHIRLKVVRSNPVSDPADTHFDKWHVRLAPGLMESYLHRELPTSSKNRKGLSSLAG